MEQEENTKKKGETKGGKKFPWGALVHTKGEIKIDIIYFFQQKTGKDQKMKFPIYVNYQDYFLINLLMN